jgi:3'-5' exoribonuclease
MKIRAQDIPKAHVWITDVAEGTQVQGAYLVREKRVGQTRNQKSFLSIVLADRTGQMEAKVWEGAEDLTRRFKKGDILQIVGKGEVFRDQVQINVTTLTVPESAMDPTLFLQSSSRHPEEMMKALRKILKGIQQPHLRNLVDRFLGDREFVFRFQRAPAAKHFHHSYLGGLLEHTLSVCQMAQEVVKFYPQLDRDLLLTGAFLHDIGKVRELTCETGIDYTDEGRLVGHVVLGANMVDEKLAGLKGFPQELAVRLKHLVLSHHGEYAFGSPKRPKFLEAFALNLIDDLDAKIVGLSEYMSRDRREGMWTDYNRLFERFFFKGDLGAADEETKEESRAESEGQASLFHPPEA